MRGQQTLPRIIGYYMGIIISLLMLAAVWLLPSFLIFKAAEVIAEIATANPIQASFWAFYVITYGIISLVCFFNWIVVDNRFHRV